MSWITSGRAPLFFLLFAISNAASVQLVYPDTEHSKLMVNEEAISLLDSKFGEPLVVISVVGPLHSGKSFLLNQLVNNSAAFDLGRSVQPQTQGLWIWDEPVALLGGQKALLIDTEGFYAPDVSALYDAKLFSISVLLSSHVLFNVVRQVDQSTMESIELMGRRAELFGLKASIQNVTGDTTISDMPTLHLVIRDFFQEFEGYESCMEWLKQEMLTAKRRNDPGKHLEPTLESVMHLFPDIECTTLGFPQTNVKKIRDLQKFQGDILPEFLSQVVELKKKVSNAPLKTIGGISADGQSIATLVRGLVSRANGDVFPLVPSPWASYVEQQIGSATEAAVAKFTFECESMSMAPEQRFLSELDGQKSAALVQWVKHTRGFRSLEEPKKHLQELLDQQVRTYVERNDMRIGKFLREVQDTQLQAASLKFDEIQLPIPSKRFNRESNAIINAIEAKIQATLKHYAKSPQYSLEKLRTHLSEKHAAFGGRNRDLMEKLFSSSSDAALQYYVECGSVAYLTSTPMKHKEFEYTRKKCETDAHEQFSNATNTFAEEAFFNTWKNSLAQQLLDHEKDIQVKYAKAVSQYASVQRASLEGPLRTWQEGKLKELPVEGESLDESFSLVASRLTRDFEELMAGYSPESYTPEMQRFHGSLSKIKTAVELENARKIKQKIEVPLDHLYKRLHANHAKNFWFDQSFVSFAGNMAQTLLREQVKSPKLRHQVIELWLRDDLTEIRADITGWQTKAYIGLSVFGLMIAVIFWRSSQRGTRLKAH